MHYKIVIGHAVGWALASAGIAVTLVVRARGAPPPVVSVLVYSCGIAIGLGGYLAGSPRGDGRRDSSAYLRAVIWSLAFCTGAFVVLNWPVLFATTGAVVPLADVRSTTLNLPGQVSPTGTTHASRSIVLMPGQVGLLLGFASFGAIGGFFSGFLGRRRSKSLRSIVGALTWTVGAVVGGYVAFVGFYVFGGTLAAAFGSAALFGLASGAALAGFAGGFAAAFLALSSQSVLIGDGPPA